MAIELIVAAIGVAERVLTRFLDRPERELRKKHLEAEIRALVRAEVRGSLSKPELQQYIVASMREISVVAAQLPDIEVSQHPKGRNPVVLAKHPESSTATQALSRLQAAVDTRRKIISSALTDVKTEIDSSTQQKEGQAAVADSDQVHTWKHEPHAPVTALRPADPAKPTEVQVEGKGRKPTLTARSALDGVQKRVAKRRTKM